MKNKEPGKIQYAVDKVDRILFRQNKATPIDDKQLWGQDFFTGKPKDRKLPREQRPCWEVTLYTETGNYKLNNALTPFAKRLMISANAFWDAGIETVTSYQFYRDLGNAGNPNAADTRKMWQALMAMNNTIATITNQKEIDRYKNRKTIKIKQARLLDFEPAVDINKETGSVTSFTIRLTIKPVLFRNAEDLKQIRRIDSRLLNPLNNSNNNLDLIFYLVDAILYRKDPKISPKILFEKVFRDLGLIGNDQNTRTQRTRTKSKIKQVLEFYSKIGFIQWVEFTKNGVVINLANNCNKEQETGLQTLENVTKALITVTQHLETVTKPLLTVAKGNTTLLLSQRIGEGRKSE